MTTEEKAPEEGFWLDISVHKRVHKQLTAWGKRLGLTPEGYAKLLIYQAMHPLLAEEASVKARVNRETLEDVLGGNTPQELSMAMWQDMMGQYAQTPDLLPAPFKVEGSLRFYRADDFSWPDTKRPPHDEACVRDGTVLKVS